MAAVRSDGVVQDWATKLWTGVVILALLSALSFCGFGH